MVCHVGCGGNVRSFNDGYFTSLYCVRCNLEVDEQDIDDKLWAEKGDDYEVEEL